MEKKITKAQVLNTIKAQVEGMTFDGDVTAEDVITYCDTTLAQLANRSAKAAERAAQKRAEGDALRDAVLACVTDEWQTGEQITAALDMEDVTKAKVTARLTQLAKAESIVKEVQKVGDRRLTVYRLADGE